MMDFRVQYLFQRHWRSLKKKSHVVGFDGQFRPKIVRNKDTGVPSWRIYVDKKLPLDMIRKRDLIPPFVSDDIGSTLTDVVAIGKPVIPPLLGLEKSTQDRWRPLEAGISAMHENGTACSLDAFFEDVKSGMPLQASNYHCYAMEGDAKVGDNILNPSPYDGGIVPQDVTGKFVFGVPITFDSYTCGWRNTVARKLAFWSWMRPAYAQNSVDFSLATVDVDWKNKVAKENFGFIRWEDPVEGEAVAKCGRTTDWTCGVWESTSVNIQVQYRRGIAFMTDIAMADIECAGGDSGSPMYYFNPNPKKVYLKGIYNAALFAGSDEGKTFGCKASNIFKACEELGRPLRLVTK